jgi:hypothetical protein
MMMENRRSSTDLWESGAILLEKKPAPRANLSTG